MTIDKDLLDLLEAKGLLKKEEEKAPPLPYKAKGTVARFIRYLNVRDGEDKVPNYIIFYHYRKRMDYHVRDLLGKIGFFKQFGKLFKSHRVGKRRSYFLNKDSFDLTREGILEAKHYEQTYEIYRRAIQDSRKKKKKAKASAQKERQP